MSNSEYYTVYFQLYKNNKKWKVLEIITNLPKTKGLSVDDAFESWLARTDKYTEESLVEYINSKSSMTNCYAYTQKELEHSD